MYKLLLSLLILMFFPGISWGAAPHEVEVPESARALGARDKDGSHKVHAKLILDRSHATPGESVRVGVLLEIAPEWHTYWKNSGDAGLATTIAFSSPDATFSPMTWPAPSVYVQGGLITTYGYADRVLHTSSFLVPLSPGPRTITAEVDYLACKVTCIPGRATLTSVLEVGEVSNKTSFAALFDATERDIPRQPEDEGMRTTLTLSQTPVRPADVVTAQVDVDFYETPLAHVGVSIEDTPQPEHAFVPDRSPNIVWTVKSVSPRPRGARIVVEGRAKRDVPRPGNRLQGVLRLRRPKEQGAGDVLHPILIDHEIPMGAPGADVEMHALGASDDVPAEPDVTQTPAAPEPEPLSLWYVLGLALLGGLLLNVMPCVFPVLTLKVASLADVAHKGRRETFLHGVAYTMGILVTMGVLALVVVLFKATGHQAGWGFQFQNPHFLVGLSAVLVAFALNLFGVFEVGVPMGGKLGAISTPETGLGRSFMEGLLCVLLSTPCSAPFMGTAVGFALASDAPTIFLVFALLGLGLASPFLVLTAWPAWAKWLPKPGEWLIWLKQFLGFTLLGTALWLLWILGASFGSDGMTRGLMFLFALSLGSWLYGLVQFGQGARKWVVYAVALGMIVWTGRLLTFDVQTQKSASEGEVQGYDWKPFDEEMIAKQLEAGRPVFVDFTADWCITCKVNERVVLAQREVRWAVKTHNIVMVKADWTRRDDRIRAVLARFGKAGVPMYLFYEPTNPSQPHVLPEVLTPGMVVDVFARAR